MKYLLMVCVDESIEVSDPFTGVTLEVVPEPAANEPERAAHEHEREHPFRGDPSGGRIQGRAHSAEHHARDTERGGRRPSRSRASGGVTPASTRSSPSAASPTPTTA